MIRSLFRFRHGLAVALAALLAAPLQAADDKTAAKPIDVVICLDVSNSMDGLIGSAKIKLWDIVNDLAKAKPTPELRVALYSYGSPRYEKADGWVRKEIDLTNDLDAVYQKLNALTTHGGEEYVARVSQFAIEQQKWSEDRDALKLIFVCGNEPAAQDKQVQLKDVAEKAVSKGIVINTIFCGRADNAHARDWKEFASMAKGQFASIDQDRGTVVVATPHDKDLAELSAKLNATYVVYGKAGEDKRRNQVAQDANAAKAAPEAAAARAVAKGSALYRNDMWDLVDRMKNDPKFDIKKVPDDELCEELKKMKPDEREAFVKKKAEEREAIQKQIAELSAKREAYIKDEMKKNPSKADQAFDAAVRGALRQQAAEKGIKIPE